MVTFKKEIYSLKIISGNPEAKGSAFKQYNLDNKKIIGVDKGEPFIIKFMNHTHDKVQVRVSVDGTDVLTGNLNYDCQALGKMWIVEGFGTLELKAWPETNHGGASFVFGDSEKGVAVNTHGNTSRVGEIRAEVYCEVPFPKYEPSNWGSNIRYGITIGNFGNLSGSSIIAGAGYDADYYSCNVSDISETSDKVAVGAGEYVKQKIAEVDGLKNPVLDQVLTLHYERWQDLHKKLKAKSEKKNIDLSSVPKQKRDVTYRYGV